MAKNKVYLGYDDEVASDKNLANIDFKVNMIGGKPKWPLSGENILHPKCAMCGFNQLLVVQCYAPLEDSLYHRTIYIFACINVNCWEQSEGWTCIRSQILDDAERKPSKETNKVQSSNSTWCSGADDWDDFDDMENGNVSSSNKARATNNMGNRVSDEDDESNSFEIDVAERELGNLQMNDTKNANKMGDSRDCAMDGATGVLESVTSNSVSAHAELESGEEDLVTVEDIPMLNSELNFLLEETSAFASDILECLSAGHLIFEPHFMSVEEEQTSRKNSTTEDRVAELLLKYNKENGGDLKGDKLVPAAGGFSKNSEETEQYEDVIPLHGDKLFHLFVTRLQENPEQVLRYSRGGLPLLGAQLSRTPGVCEKCGAKRTYELQLMPFLSSVLRLADSDSSPSSHSATRSLDHLHFLSVLVFTCGESCWSPSDLVVKEEIMIQPQTF